jgi:hypothetical protein
LGGDKIGGVEVARMCFFGGIGKDGRGVVGEQKSKPFPTGYSLKRQGSDTQMPRTQWYVAHSHDRPNLKHGHGV